MLRYCYFSAHFRKMHLCVTRLAWKRRNTLFRHSCFSRLDWLRVRIFNRILKRKGHTVAVPPCCLHNEKRCTMSFIFTRDVLHILTLRFSPPSDLGDLGLFQMASSIWSCWLQYAKENSWSLVNWDALNLGQLSRSENSLQKLTLRYDSAKLPTFSVIERTPYFKQRWLLRSKHIACHFLFCITGMPRRQTETA